MKTKLNTPYQVSDSAFRHANRIANDTLAARVAELEAALKRCVDEFDLYAKKTAGVSRSRNTVVEAARAALKGAK